VKKFDHPAKRLTRSTNDPVGGPQTSPKSGKAPRSFEKGNPATCKPKPA
jgi:hypothetical protein